MFGILGLLSTFFLDCSLWLFIYLKKIHNKSFFQYVILVMLIITGLFLGTSTSNAANIANKSSKPKKPKIEYICTVAPDILSIHINSRYSEYGNKIPYEKKDGDLISRKTYFPMVYREGKFIGCLVGKEEKYLYTPDKVVGEKLNTDWADSPTSYLISSYDDLSYIKALSPKEVYRKSKPSDLVRGADSKPGGGFKYDGPMEHIIYLRLPHSLQKGKEYKLSFNKGPFKEQKLIYNPENQRSEAVHISHIGFRPDDPVKVAFLSCWMGSGGGVDYSRMKKFNVLEDKTGKRIFSGEIKLSKAADDKTEDENQGNYNGTDVYEMDFSEFSKPGTYRVFVEKVGCSYPFKIDKDVWRNAFWVSARGFYHQRSGIELGPPYTEYRRPRCFHPDDGVKIYESTASLMETGNGLNRKDSNFGNLVNGRTNEIVENAWGGYMDAGDWDRRIQHLRASRYLLELAGSFPEYFDKISLNIPESNNGLPDIVSESLFNIDCYRRMQTPEGGIRGGIESAEHPKHGETSWEESLDIFAYAPGLWSSYEYAGVAARAANCLKSWNPEMAEIYTKSALSAMHWAEKELAIGKGKEYIRTITGSRCLAAVEMYRLSGEQKWQDIFINIINSIKSDTRHNSYQDAAWVCLNIEKPKTNKKVREKCKNILLHEADKRVRTCSRTGFHWALNPDWNTAGEVSLIRAHAITGDEKYLRAEILACQIGAGANPINVCYTTGVGHEYPKHPLHLDSRRTNQPPPPGITVFGPYILGKKEWGRWTENIIRTMCYPESDKWPAVEAFWDIFWYVPINEFTVQYPMAQNAYIWGYLAARK